MYMQTVQSTDVQSVDEQNLMIRIWNSGIVQNVMVIMNTVRIICSRIHMSSDVGKRSGDIENSLRKV